MFTAADKDSNYGALNGKPLDLLKYTALLGFKNSIPILFFSITLSLPLMHIPSRSIGTEFPQETESSQGIEASRGSEFSQAGDQDADISNGQIVQVVSKPPDAQPDLSMPAPSNLRIIK